MSPKMKKIVLLGPQASGKGTQSEIIMDFLNIPLIAAGQVLRNIVSKDTPLGRKIKKQMSQGLLVADEQVIDLVIEELDHKKYKNGFLLDGFPRNLNQAEALTATHEIDGVFNIEISDQEAIKRIAGRRICSKGHIFHLKFKVSSKGDICDICGEKLYQRNDDKEGAVRKRLAIYRDKTSKLLDYYKEKNKLVVFDGKKSIAEVSEDILKYLKLNVK